MRERDYERAIGVYKELAFFEADAAKRAVFSYEVGEGYRLAKKYDLAIAAFSSVLESEGAGPALVQRAYLQLAAVSLAMKVPTQVPLYLDRVTGPEFAPIAHVLRGSAAAQQAHWGEAHEQFDRAAALATGARIGSVAREFDASVANGPATPWRSPWLAAGLSTVVPGAGQVYTGHYVDALQAFAFIGSFALASYAAYRFEEREGGPYVLTGALVSVTALFHVANVVGAERTARYFNERSKESVLGPLDTRLASLRF